MAETTKGFEIALNLQEKMLRIRVWGEWDGAFERKYELTLQSKIFELSAQARWQIWYILVDFTGFAVISEEVQRMFRTHLATLQKQGLKKIAYLGNTSPPLCPFGPARDEPLQSAFTSKEEAMQWLLNV